MTHRRYSRGTHSVRGPLPLDLADFLLAVDRPAAAIGRLHALGILYDPFAQFVYDQMPVNAFLALWRQHGAYLRAEARRRDLSVPDPGTYQPFPSGCWVRSSDPDDDVPPAA